MTRTKLAKVRTLGVLTCATRGEPLPEDEEEAGGGEEKSEVPGHLFPTHEVEGHPRIARDRGDKDGNEGDRNEPRRKAEPRLEYCPRNKRENNCNW